MEQLNLFGPEPIRLSQVMFRGIAQAAQKALLVTFVCTEVYIAVEKSAAGNLITKRTIKTTKSIFSINLYIICTYISVKYVF